MSSSNSNGDVAQRGLWSSRLMFILAAAGSAIGLGNIWKFPYIAGRYGGGAFVIMYLACIALIGVPILIAEIVIGRASRKNPVGAFKALARGRKPWIAVGFLGVASGFVILSYYSVVAGWTLAYFTKSLAGSYSGVDAGAIDAQFGALLGNPWQQVGWHTLFMLMTIGIVIFGIREGLERWIAVLMPLLFVILIALVIYGLAAGDARGGLAYLFKPEWSKLVTDSAGNYTARPMLEAMGHAFFTLSLGMGAMITYGSYLGDDENITSAALMVAGLDTLIALLASIAIFTILFKYNLDPSAAGPGLVFKVLPLAFAQMPGGRIIGMAFFMLLAFAALTSAISLLEVVVAHFIDDRKWTRRLATLVMGGIIWALGLLSAFSNNLLAGFKVPLLTDKEGQGMVIFDAVDLLATNYMLPIGGFFIAVFAGWFLDERVLHREVREGGGSQISYRVWRAVVRVVSPAAVFIVIMFMMNSDFRTSTGSAICDAARAGKFTRVEKLLDRDPALAADRAANGWAPLHYAARYGHQNVLVLLLSQGADPNLPADRTGATALHLAAQKGGTTAIATLLEYGARVDPRETDAADRRTPLHYAVKNGDAAAARLLLDAGADVNAADGRGWTPLHYAAHRGSLAVAQLLLDRGADVAARDRDGHTPLGLPSIKPHQLVADLIRERGGKE